MKPTERSAYDLLSEANKKLVDTDIAINYRDVKTSDDVSLGWLRERGAKDIESLLRSKTAILKQAREAGIKPNKPTESFPPQLSAQAIARTR